MTVAGEPFPTLDDLLAAFRALAQEHPEQARLFSYGQSRQGKDLLALELGTGPWRALAYAFPQPDEPLGGPALLEWARLLLRGEGPRSFRWLLLPCVDPDGAHLNEGWSSRPPDLAAYARRHYRPPEGEQVEWAFPCAEPFWRWDRPLPETLALRSLLGSFRPQLLFPLHNALLGGCYAFLSAGGEPLAAEVAQVWRSRGLPTHLGEPELPFAALQSEGVYRLPSLAELASALRAWGVGDPAGLLRCGAPAYEVAARLGTRCVVVLELPLFVVPGIDDTRPAGLSHRRLLQAVLEEERAVFAEWQSWLRRAEPFLRHDTPYRRVLEAHAGTTPLLLEATGRWVRTAASPERPATFAELVDGERIAPYLHLLPLGVLVQALAAEAGLGAGPSPEHRRLLEEAEAHLHGRLTEVLAGLEARPVSPRLLVEITVAAMRLAAGMGAI